MSETREPVIAGLMFVDESTAKDYLLVAATLRPTQLADARKVMRRLVLKGQHRVHMKTEGDSRRRLILAEISKVNPQITIYWAGEQYQTDYAQRTACITRLISDAARDLHTELVMEYDESRFRRDQQTIIDATRDYGCMHRLAYRHARASEEPLLIIPDAVGWAWARGGEWKNRCAKLNVSLVPA